MTTTTRFYGAPRETVARFLEPGDQVAVIVTAKHMITFPRTAGYVANHPGTADDGALVWATVLDKPTPVAALVTGQQHGGAHDLHLDIDGTGRRHFQPGDREQLVHRAVIDIDPWQEPTVEGEVWSEPAPPADIPAQRPPSTALELPETYNGAVALLTSPWCINPGCSPIEGPHLHMRVDR